MTTPINVLLVEDNQGDALLITRKLKVAREAHHQLTHVKRLDEALAELQAAAFNVVLLDIHLPDAVGLETIEQVIATAPSVPIVVLTGLDDDDIATNAVRGGAQDYLVKGQIDTQSLVRAIRYAIERKRGEELRNKLFHTDRLVAIGQLAAGVAHEINNPADYILGNLSLMRDHLVELEAAMNALRRDALERFGVDGQKMVDQALDRHDAVSHLGEFGDMVRDNRTGMERIRSIVRDLRTFSRIERDEIEWVQINDVVEVACNMTENQIRHRARLSKTLGPVPEIAGDRAKLSQALVNLLVNAAHAIEEGASDRNEIRIRTRLLGGKLSITVEDTGSGIPEENMRRLFEPFFTTKGRDTGTGLGLPLCAETVQKHGGTIQVSSKIGQGSRFEILLPQDTGLVTSAPRRRSLRVPTGERSRILLIDDDPLVRSGMRRRLRRHHDIVEAENGASALERIAADGEFDVILCDLMMPQLDGPAMYQEIAERAPHLRDRIVFVSGGAFTNRTKEFVSNAQAIVLEKPIATALLLGVINQIAGQIAGQSAGQSAAGQIAGQSAGQSAAARPGVAGRLNAGSRPGASDSEK